MLKQLQEAKTSSASEISAALANFKANNDEIRKKELEIERERIEREEARKDKLASEEAELMRQRRIAEDRKARQDEAMRDIQQQKQEENIFVSG